MSLQQKKERRRKRSVCRKPKPDAEVIALRSNP